MTSGGRGFATPWRCWSRGTGRLRSRLAIYAARFGYHTSWSVEELLTRLAGRAIDLGDLDGLRDEFSQVLQVDLPRHWRANSGPECFSKFGPRLAQAMAAMTPDIRRQGCGETHFAGVVADGGGVDGFDGAAAGVSSWFRC